MNRAVSLSVALMAHPRRRGNVHLIRHAIGTGLVTEWDRISSVWDTGRRALLAYDPTATHHLVLQDDVIVPRRLIEGCRKMLRHVPPYAPVSLYIGKTRSSYAHERFRMAPVIETAQRRRASFAVFEGPWWGPGIILPTKMIPDVVAYGDERTNVSQYDHKIANYFVDRGIPCWHTVPSLVDHIHDQTARSLLNHGNGPGRRALSFIGSHRSAANTAWSSRVVTVDHLPAPVRDAFPTTPSNQ